MSVKNIANFRLKRIERLIEDLLLAYGYLLTPDDIHRINLMRHRARVAADVSNLVILDNILKEIASFEKELIARQNNNNVKP